MLPAGVPAGGLPAELAAPAPYKRGRKVAIVGFAKPHRDEAPYHDPEYEIWGVNDAWSFMLRCDRHFELHSQWIYEWELRRAKGHQKWMRDFGGRGGIVYLLDERPDLPKAERFPFEDVVNSLWPERATEGDHRTSRPYLTSSIAYMQALAIAERFEEILIVGVDMAADSEYCVAPDTKVLTSDLHWVPAAEVAVGSQVIAFDEHPGGGEDSTRAYRQWRSATVEKAERLTRPCYRLTMEDGTELISSAEHRWLTYSEHEHRWRRTDEMVTSSHRPGRPTRIVKVMNTWVEDRSWDAGYLAASFDGEGHLTQRTHAHGTQVTLGFSQRANAMADEVVAAAGRLGFELTKSANQSGGFNYTLANGRATLLEFLGRIRPRRLMAGFRADMLGVMHRKDAVAVEKMEYLGELPVIGLKTTTGTFVAEGFASHNSDQRPACEYLLGLAKGRGIRIRLPESCKLLEGPLYGRGAMNPGGEKLTTIQLSDRLKQLEQREQMALKGCEQMAGLCNQIRGAMTANREMLAEYPGDGPRIKARIDDLERQFGEAQQTLAKHKENLDQVRGALIDCRHWIGLTPWGGDARMIPPVLMAPLNASVLAASSVVESDPAPQHSTDRGGEVWVRAHEQRAEVSPNGAADLEAAHVA